MPLRGTGTVTYHHTAVQRATRYHRPALKTGRNLGTEIISVEGESHYAAAHAIIKEERPLRSYRHRIGEREHRFREGSENDPFVGCYVDNHGKINGMVVLIVIQIIPSRIPSVRRDDTVAVQVIQQTVSGTVEAALAQLPDANFLPGLTGRHGNDSLTLRIAGIGRHGNGYRPLRFGVSYPRCIALDAPLGRVSPDAHGHRPAVVGKERKLRIIHLDEVLLSRPLRVGTASQNRGRYNCGQHDGYIFFHNRLVKIKN